MQCRRIVTDERNSKDRVERGRQGNITSRLIRDCGSVGKVTQTNKAQMPERRSNRRTVIHPHLTREAS
jgi:hypothetical protein